MFIILLLLFFGVPAMLAFGGWILSIVFWGFVILIGIYAVCWLFEAF